MNETRIKLLEDLGFVWVIRGNREEHMNLRQFHQQEQSEEGRLSLNPSSAPVGPSEARSV